VEGIFLRVEGNSMNEGILNDSLILLFFQFFSRYFFLARHYLTFKGVLI
jgi:hypothetical protein